MRLLFSLLAGSGLLAACGFELSVSGSQVADAPDQALPTEDATIDAPVDARIEIDARPPIDAPPDADLRTWVDVEMMTIPCTGQSRTSTTVLASAGTYRLRASGTCVANRNRQPPSRADAEYIGYNVGTAVDVFDNVDTGIAVNDTTPGAVKQPRWGAYSVAHVYTVDWTGADQTIVVQYHEADLSNNEGTLTLTIQSFQ